MKKIVITIEEDCTVTSINDNPGSGSDTPVDPGGEPVNPLPSGKSGCAFFRKYVVDETTAIAKMISDPDFAHVHIYTIGIVDNPNLPGFTPRHTGFSLNTTNQLDLSIYSLPVGCIVFVQGEWK